MGECTALSTKRKFPSHLPICLRRHGAEIPHSFLLGLSLSLSLPQNPPQRPLLEVLSPEQSSPILCPVQEMPQQRNQWTGTTWLWCNLGARPDGCINRGYFFTKSNVGQSKQMHLDGDCFFGGREAFSGVFFHIILYEAAPQKTNHQFGMRRKYLLASKLPRSRRNPAAPRGKERQTQGLFSCQSCRAARFNVLGFLMSCRKKWTVRWWNFLKCWQPETFWLSYGKCWNMHVNWDDCLGLDSSVQRSWKELDWFHVHLFDVVFVPEPRLQLPSTAKEKQPQGVGQEQSSRGPGCIRRALKGSLMPGGGPRKKQGKAGATRSSESLSRRSWQLSHSLHKAPKFHTQDQG